MFSECLVFFFGCFLYFVTFVFACWLLVCLFFVDVFVVCVYVCWCCNDCLCLFVGVVMIVCVQGSTPPPPCLLHAGVKMAASATSATTRRSAGETLIEFRREGLNDE